jgi:hypothetical protein
MIIRVKSGRGNQPVPNAVDQYPSFRAASARIRENENGTIVEHQGLKDGDRLQP